MWLGRTGYGNVSVQLLQPWLAVKGKRVHAFVNRDVYSVAEYLQFDFCIERWKGLTKCWNRLIKRWNGSIRR
ncbi:uncharacterized protein EI90DRAFT_3049895 [Cantharellus anzutake]|uniref:uncharacterized protein n=1 Tax=Cantharellus anzutake TaxID=1750568 RepID=UPI0019083D9B|nr:uncharacterized protein EI90DRAFT_3049895 [Cantharellus anzutake]KAF8334706.1 hypothetical protein EI90DRAFT_3049895 [Cantharellus anzutake]